MLESLTDMVLVFGKVVDHIANSEDGQKMTDNLATIFCRLYNRLVASGISGDHAVPPSRQSFS